VAVKTWDSHLPSDSYSHLSSDSYSQANSRFLGFIETQSADSFPGAAFRDGFFFVMGKLGVAKLIFLDGALPRGTDV